MEENKIINILAAKQKGITGSHEILFSDEQTMNTINAFYYEPKVIHPILFTPERKIEDDEWFFIELFEADFRTMIAPYVEVGKSTADHNIIEAVDYKNIEVVYKITGTKIVFTKIRDSYRIKNKHFLLLDEHPEIKKYEQGIEFSGIVDAYYDGENKLYFKSYSTVRPLFPGIEKFFREATEEEKEQFLSNDFFSVNTANIKIGITAAKRIAAILDDERIDLSNQETQNKIREYAEKYSEAQIRFNDNGKLIINSNKELNSTLKLLSGRYYTSELTGEKMEAHDASKLS